jgi:hypothetical protein
MSRSLKEESSFIYKFRVQRVAIVSHHRNSFLLPSGRPLGHRVVLRRVPLSNQK